MDLKHLYHLFLPFCFFISLPANAQICDGNLGENIFESGDFGSGSATVVLQDPQIAPGFLYTYSPPPMDGYYLLTNNTGHWASIYPTWLRITDNSPDPNGYMMVVNASYTPGLFYEQEIAGLCENTVYEFSADVINLIVSGGNLIKPNISFLIDGTSEFTTGAIPENEAWNTYGFTFSTAPGQTSVTLSLRNNAPGGAGNDLAIDNITFRPCGPQALILPVEVANICEDGDPIALDATVVGDQYDDPAFIWQESFDEGVTWQNIPGANTGVYLHTELASGFYYYRYLLANGEDNLLNSKCRVVSNTKIVHVVPKLYFLSDTLCEGLIYSVGSSEHTTSGIFVDSLISSLGCDSIVNLDLTIVEDPGLVVDIQANSPTCSNMENGSIVIDGVMNAVSPYHISIDGIFLDPGDSLSGLSVGDYFLEVSDYYGCRAERVINLSAISPFFVDLGPDVTIDLGGQVLLNAFTSEEVTDFLWSPFGLNDCNCLQQQWIPTTSTMVTFSATSLTGCMAADSVFIHVVSNRKVYIPNSFSPNLDGINDYFTVLGENTLIQQVEKLQIFNRWGDLIFEQHNFQPNDNSLGWDGTFNGRPLPPGVFIYLAEVRFLDNKVEQYVGDVRLVK